MPRCECTQQAFSLFFKELVNLHLHYSRQLSMNQLLEVNKAVVSYQLSVNNFQLTVRNAGIQKIRHRTLTVTHPVAGGDTHILRGEFIPPVAL